MDTKLKTGYIFFYKQVRNFHKILQISKISRTQDTENQIKKYPNKKKQEIISTVNMVFKTINLKYPDALRFRNKSKMNHNLSSQQSLTLKLSYSQP